jgi:hypothetical protein
MALVVGLLRMVGVRAAELEREERSPVIVVGSSGEVG